MPRCASVFCTDSIRALVCETMRALSAAVKARLGAPRLEASSCPQVTGLSHSSCTQARSCNSCAGLRVANPAEMAKAETRWAWRAMAARAAASSMGCTSHPPASCPPASDSMASLPSSSTKPLFLICAAS
jgi:hypothetical protein